MRVGQSVVIPRERCYVGCPVAVIGQVVYVNKYFVTVKTTAGYCESVLLRDCTHAKTQTLKKPT